ncbi:MAG: hypothetical protein IJM27_02235 [Eubacterium sp.]|nr:hypothetical protein [Eubacterium sp.]
MENTTDYLKPYLLLICRKKQKIGTGKVRDNNMDGVWDEERTLKEISYFKKNDQIAFLTQEIIDDIVLFKESYEVKL